MGMIVGLTGGIGSGKSTVSRSFQEYGIPIVDVDRIAREVVQPGEEAWKKIVEHFGPDILLSNQEIDRKKLGQLIFQNKQERKVLNEITHPIIIQTTMERAYELAKTNQQVIVDIPLLFESKRETLFDQIIVVYVSMDVQLQRLMARDQITLEEAQMKIESQMPLAEKKRRADIVIENEQDLEHTKEQIKQIIEAWKRLGL